MGTIIGYKDTSTVRLKNWSNMLESRKSYETFRTGSTEQELDIANLDKNVYNYYLSNYVKEAA